MTLVMIVADAYDRVHDDDGVAGYGYGPYGGGGGHSLSCGNSFSMIPLEFDIDL